MRPNRVLSSALLLRRAGPPSELAPRGWEEAAQGTGRHLATACEDVLAGSVRMVQLGHVVRLFGAHLVSASFSLFG